MSAITGIYSIDDYHVDRTRLESMLHSLAHRGADRVGLWVDRKIGIGHRLLETTLESRNERLPFVTNGGSLAITADARIDNRDELITSLHMNDRPQVEIGDGEIILRAYEKWGESAPQKLLGDFAFAIWDGHRQKLFCARDHFGVKQLYYYASHKFFAFATEIKALLSLPEIPRSLNEARIADYLLSLFADKAATLYKDIYRLPPGHALVVDRAGPRLKQYWSLNSESEVRFKTETEYYEAYLSLFKDAVSCRLRSSGAVGSTLSGGLDSSSIACMARELYQAGEKKTLHTFSAIYDEVPSCDERSYINSVLPRDGMKSFFVHAERHGPLTNWEAKVEGEDEPLWNPQMAVHWGIYEAARDQRISVLLDGMGGDAVVSHGVSYLNELAANWRWIEWLSQARAYAKRVDYPFRRVLWRRGFLPLIPQVTWRAWRMGRSRQVHTWLSGVPLSNEFIKRINLRERIGFLQERSSRLDRNSRQNHLLNISSGLWSFSLGVVDRTTALFGIERRHPFFDRRLVEFCLALPPEQKMQQGWTRLIARRAMTGILPKEIQWRAGKTNHGPNFHHKLLTTDRKTLDAITSAPPEQIKQYIDIAALRNLYYRYSSYGENEIGIILWRIVKLALWLESRDKIRKESETYRAPVFDGSSINLNPTGLQQYVG